MTVDTVAPTVTITSDHTALNIGQKAALTFTLSESATDFTSGDISFSGGSLSGFSGNDAVYYANFTPAAGSTATASISVVSNKFTDPAGNFNQVDSQVTMLVDTIAPTVTITTDDSMLGYGDVARLTFTLSESSTNFGIDDVTYSGGSLTGFSGSGSSYTANFTPTPFSTVGATVDIVSSRFTAGSRNDTRTMTSIICPLSL